MGCDEEEADGRDLGFRGRGTDGGLVVERRAAKYRHNAGPGLLGQFQHNKYKYCHAPVIIKSPSALDKTSVSSSLSALAWVRADLR